MKSISRVALGVLLFLGFAMALPAKPQQPPATKAPQKHALVRVAKALATPVVHPKLFSKMTLGTVLFSIESVNDGVLFGLTAADKAFDAISIQGKVPAIDAVYAFIGAAQKDDAKLDVWLERQEKGLFGSSN